MSILKALKDEQISSRKSHGPAVHINILTLAISGAMDLAKADGNREPTDADAIKSINSLLKGINECLDKVKDDETKIIHWVTEKHTLSGFLPPLPEQITEDKIRLEIGLLKDANEKLNIGQVMKHFKENFADRYDGKALSIIAKEMLQ